jgi:type II secretory pathway component PulK
MILEVNGGRRRDQSDSEGSAWQASAPLASRRHRRGVVLIAVLVVVTLLLLAAYQYVEMMSAEYKAANTIVRAAQARAAAMSGVYYAAALLADPNSLSGTLGSNPYDNAGVFQGVSLGDSSTPRFQVKFSVVAPLGPDESASDASSFRYGVTDESGKINPNALMQIDPTGKALYNALMLLPNMTADVADAVVDWIDPDDDPRPNGAENDYYMGQSPPYRCKNGPLDSLEEMLLIRGVTPELLFGTDRNRNGAPDPGEGDDGSGTPGDRGWSAYLTVYTRERNVDSQGNPRINLNDTDTTTLYQNLTTALGDQTLADFIMAYRFLGAYTPASNNNNSGGGNNRGPNIPTIVTMSKTPITSQMFNMSGTPRQSIPSLFALVNAQVGVTKEGGLTQSTMQVGGGTSGGGGGARGTISMTTVTPTTVTVYGSPLADQGKLAQLLPILLDKCTTRKETEIPPRLNVNTASLAALATLPGLTETDVEAIQGVRPPPGDASWTDPNFQTPAWLMTEAKLSPTKLQALERYVTTQTEVYRIQAIGYFMQGGPLARVEAIVDTNGGNPRIISFRDLSTLGKGFDIER